MGDWLGFLEGSPLGLSVGGFDGDVEGTLLGFDVGSRLGARVGNFDGCNEG